MSPFSVVFLGTSDFAVPSLRALHADDAFDLKLVVTQPDKPAGRKQVMTPPPVKVEAEKLGIQVLQPDKAKELGTTLYPLPASIDYLVVVSYGQLLPESLLKLPKIAPINVHASLLPELRGASPLQHAILLGFNESGVTIQRMVKELDAGPILNAKATTLANRETTQTLHDRLAKEGASLLVETLKNPLKETPQDDTKITHCRKLSKEDGIADPKTMTADQIDRMVRALTPWPGVTITGNKILETSLEEGTDDLKIECAENTTLFVRSMQPPSRKPMTGKAFGLGRSL